MKKGKIRKGVVTLTTLVGLGLGSCAGTMAESENTGWPVGNRSTPRTTQTLENAKKNCKKISIYDGEKIRKFDAIARGKYGYVCLEKILTSEQKKFTIVDLTMNRYSGFKKFVVEPLKSEYNANLNAQHFAVGYAPPSVGNIVDYALIKEDFRKAGIKLQLQAKDLTGVWTLETNGIMTGLIDSGLVKEGTSPEEQKAAYHLKKIEKATTEFMRNTAPVGNNTDAINDYVAEMSKLGVELRFTPYCK